MAAKLKGGKAGARSRFSTTKSRPLARKDVVTVETMGRLLADWRIGGCSGAAFLNELKPLMERSAKPMKLSYAGFFSAAHKIMEMHLAEHEAAKEEARERRPCPPIA